jgi:hypothetical protein
MKIFFGPKAAAIFLYIIVVFAATSPVWSIRYFVVQDGASHVYNAYLLSELVTKDPSVSNWLTFNTLAVPNATGHWLLAILLQVFSGYLSMKVMTVGCYATFVASVCLLRYRVAGTDDLPITVLLASALAFNWLWFVGLYNFMIGLIIFVNLNSICFRWIFGLSVRRTITISLIFIAIYLSHIVTFAAAIGSVFIMALCYAPLERRRNFKYLSLALIPSIVLAVLYRLSTYSIADVLYPTWRWLTESASLTDALRNLLVDPFIIISRQTLPFVDFNSKLFVLFSPGIWTAVSLGLLSIPSIQRMWRGRFFDKKRLPFLIIFILSILGVFIAPDDFGLSNGGLLRERVLICGLCLFVPFFDLQKSRLVKHLAQVSLIYVIIFQTAALWDYGLHTETAVKQVAAAESEISDTDSIATIVVSEAGYRYHSIPDAELGLLTSVGKKSKVLDNYELGHYLFPLVTKEQSDREFIHAISGSHVFVSNGPENEFSTTLSQLKDCLSGNHQRFTKLIVLRQDPRVDAVLYKWFDPIPVYDSGPVRVLRHRD